MFSNEQPTRTNYLRRILGVILCLLPLEIAFASLIFGLLGKQYGVHYAVRGAIAAIVIACFNCYLSFGRPWIHWIIHRSREGYRHISILPGIGTVIAVIAVVFGFGSIDIALLVLLATALDTGGSLWFLFSTWKDKSLWDK
jgi:hypothetical protein